MIRIDENRIVSEIEAKKPRTIVLNAPDGLLPAVSRLAATLGEKYGIEVFVLGEHSYGICDIDYDDANRLGTDLVFHIGHTVSVPRMAGNVILVDAFDDADFSAVLDAVATKLQGMKRIGLCTSSQHLPAIPQVRSVLEQKGFQVSVGKGKGLLNDGQVFGCEFYPVYNMADGVDAFLFLGQSRFHAAGVALSTGRPTFMVDPYLQIVEDVSQVAEQIQKRAILGIYKAMDAKDFAVVVGLKEGQMMKGKSLEIKKRLEDHGKRVLLLAMREITEDRLQQFPGVDVFIQTACPRISLDGAGWKRLILSVPQTEALLAMLEGKDPYAFLEKRHWL